MTNDTCNIYEWVDNKFKENAKAWGFGFILLWFRLKNGAMIPQEKKKGKDIENIRR